MKSLLKRLKNIGMASENYIETKFPTFSPPEQPFHENFEH